MNPAEIIVHVIVYMDDSGDDKLRVYSGLLIHESKWKATLESIKQYRRALKKREGIFVTLELHGTDFVSGRGRIAPHVVPKGARCRIFKETLDFHCETSRDRTFQCLRSLP
jgi:hypothetical protein